jgi:hypothetical protein
MKAQESGWIINVTSRMGSLDDLDEWAPGYRLSKAALNVMTKMMAIELEGWYQNPCSLSGLDKHGNGRRGGTWNGR